MTLTAETILDVLDRSAAYDWPDFWGITMTEYHALRLIAVRSKSGDDWGLVFDSIRGSVIDEDLALGAGTWTSICGSRVPVERHLVMRDRHVPLRVPEDRETASLNLGSIVIDGPAGPLQCDDETSKRLDLRPGRVCNLDRSSENPLDVLLIRAYLAAFPGSLWPPIEESAATLDIEDGEIIVVSDAFQHVLGPNPPVDRDDLKAIAGLPSGSRTYRSLIIR